MEYRVVDDFSAAQLEHLLERGWRRFGRIAFRPKCRTCRECQSLRVVLSDFRHSKSQRRVLRRMADLDVAIVPPQLTIEHIDLYNRYHLDMHRRRGWPYREITPEGYFESFLDGEFSFCREFQYRLRDQMIAVGIVDMTQNVMSSAYFFHDPDFRHTSPGTWSVLHEIEAGVATGRQWLYMGYYIRDCVSMNYKNRFRPFQTLDAYVNDDSPAVWIDCRQSANSAE